MDEHILVCLSTAPSNARIIRTAAQMAEAFRGTFTALFIETPDFSAATSEDKQRLQDNMRLARTLGAAIETVYGDDVAFQIGEFARLSGVTRIVIGRSMTERGRLFRKPTLTEKLIANSGDSDIYIIPDYRTETSYHAKKAKGGKNLAALPWDIAKTAGILSLATLIGFAFFNLGFTEANIITIYILGALLTSIFTTSWIFSLISSIVSVLFFNFFFTAPHFTLRAYDQGYPVTFLIMFVAAWITGSLASKLKEHAKQSAQAAFRTKVLFDTNQLLQKAQGKEEIVKAAANQLTKLLGRNIKVYLTENGELGEACLFSADAYEPEKVEDEADERQVAEWTLKNNRYAGATTERFPEAKCLYLAIRVKEQVYGVVGITIGENPIDAFENSVLLSILGECALALENDKNAREKEAAAILAKNEQLRANLLRSISHDLRTPLTSISGNASNLLSNGERFDETAKMQIYTDIYEDSMWLINLVENLLAVTRIEEGQMHLHWSTELMDEVIAEALLHVNRKQTEHQIRVRDSEEFMLAKMDARLVVQVIINIVDNAIKYTQEGSEIVITTEKAEDMVAVSIADNGPGIPDDMKPRVFDMFYSGANEIADSRRSLGLGLSLCRSIINAHGGEIFVTDNVPHGAVFTFTLPAGEVKLYE
jgi:two-component system sensor histidine kinase KdpD